MGLLVPVYLKRRRMAPVTLPRKSGRVISSICIFLLTEVGREEPRTDVRRRRGATVGRAVVPSTIRAVDTSLRTTTGGAY